ncbi:MAG: sigma 54-interacting transcriptional regulator [Planctomycetota bacterium]
MASFTAPQRRQAESFRQLAFGNPFSPERRAVERKLLGRRFVASDAVWSWSASEQLFTQNLAAIQVVGESLLKTLRPKVDAGVPEGDAELYEDVVAYVLYYRNHDLLLELATSETPGETTTVPAAAWQRFRDDFAQAVRPLGREPSLTPEHLFAMCFQTRRAFVQVFERIVGTSAAAANLRAEVWQSIFTHDRRRHARCLTGRMRDLPTLVMGESGTGKELVATAVARSGFRRFDASRRQFEPAGAVCPINLAAVPDGLVESTLFGHKRGSFTGASADRRGLFEGVCPRGCVFLDEIGEIPPATQVKLLRVLQERSFQRVGDTRDRAFEGKIVAATHRDLQADMAEGRFRGDLYYRLAGDVIRTPALREQIAGGADELARLVRFVADRVAGIEAGASLADEVLTCIGRDLGDGYGWPGNFRELEQCVRSVLVRGCYRPHANASPPTGRWLADADACRLTADELLDRYVAHAHARHGTHVATATALALDRRTVASRLEREK